MNYATDLLIIGTGGAGLRAAIAAADNNCKVITVGKTLLGKAHTVMAEGGINAALGNCDPQDRWQVHFADTMKEGQMINNWKMVEAMVKQARGILKELEQYGVLFDRSPEGKIMQRAFGGHSYRRTCHVGDRTGLEIMQALVNEVRRRDSAITNLEECIITSLVAAKDSIRGALGISLRTGELLVISCKAVILAAGGLARIYRRTTNAWENVGDGCALALNAGAELQDMEMIQFHPTGMIYPESAEGILVTESVRGEGGILLNSKGERFMKSYDPLRLELSTRDVVARSIFHEIQEGRGTQRGGVWLDISHKSKQFIEKKLPKMIGKFRDFSGIDITKEAMEIAPTAHYAMGGVRVDAETCATRVRGLFAAGEITAGVHGANRLGGNSLLDILVFGRQAGQHASQYALKQKRYPVSKSTIAHEKAQLLRPFQRKKGIRPIIIKTRLQSMMWKYAGIERKEHSLKAAYGQLQTMKKMMKKIKVNGSQAYNHEWIQYIELLAMIPVCDAIITSARFRKESRGAHYRTDYKNKDDKEWLRNIIVAKKAARLVLITRPVPPSPPYLRRLLQ